MAKINFLFKILFDMNFCYFYDNFLNFYIFKLKIKNINIIKRRRGDCEFTVEVVIPQNLPRYFFIVLVKSSFPFQLGHKIQLLSSFTN